MDKTSVSISRGWKQDGSLHLNPFATDIYINASGDPTFLEPSPLDPLSVASTSRAYIRKSISLYSLFSINASRPNKYVTLFQATPLSKLAKYYFKILVRRDLLPGYQSRSETF